MSKLLESLMEKTASPKTTGSKPTNCHLVQAPKTKVAEHTIMGTSFSLFAGFNFLIPYAADNLLYNMQLARTAIGVDFIFSNMLTPQAIRDAVLTRGHVLWVEGKPQMKREQWIEVTTECPGIVLEGAVALLINPQTDDGQTITQEFPWVPVIRF